MLESTRNSLNFPQRKKASSVKEDASTIAHDFIMKTRPNSRSQVIDALTGLGFSEIEANQSLRQLEDNGEIFTLEDSFLKVVLHKDTTQYSQERSKLQQAWIRARQEGE